MGSLAERVGFVPRPRIDSTQLIDIYTSTNRRKLMIHGSWARYRYREAGLIAPPPETGYISRPRTLVSASSGISAFFCRSAGERGIWFRRTHGIAKAMPWYETGAFPQPV